MSHAPFAPSAAHRWMKCTASYAACKDLPSTDSEYAQEGSFAHHFAAVLLQTGQRAASIVGARAGDFPDRVFDAVMAGHVQTYLDAVRGLVIADEGDLLIEQKVVVDPALCWGTADAVIVGERTLHVVDLKYGAGVRVEAENNDQLLIYAGGFLLGAPDPARFEDVTLHIVQPRRPEGGAHRSWTVSAPDVLTRMRTTVKYAIQEAVSDDAHFLPGDHCRFCPAASTCIALHDRAMEIAKAAFLPVPVRDLPPAEIAAALSRADVIEQWLHAVRDYALARAQAGETIPGFKLIERIGNRRWLDEANAAATLATAGIDPWAPREILSPAQAEKILGRKAAGIVKQLVTRPVTGIQLVPVSDKRPAIAAADAARVFADHPFE